MKKIIMIAPHAFPVRSSECICNAKVACALAEAGYYVDVFTCKGDFSYPSDEGMNSVLRNSPNLQVHYIEEKLGKNNLSRTYSIGKNLKSLFILFKIFLETGYFYNGITKAYDILAAVRQYVEQNPDVKYDVLITRAYFTELAAFYLKRVMNIKWIANWNDPYPTCRFPEPYGRGPHTKLPFGFGPVFKKVKNLVDIHTFPSERLRNYMIDSLENVPKEKTVVIPHMAHSKLFSLKEHSQDGILKLVSCGSVNKPRNPEPFLRALSEISHELKFTSKDIQCFFVGSYDENLCNIVNNYNLKDIVKLLPSKIYSDCIDFISSCDVSLIIEAECDEGIYLPTKFVDAIQCGVPVFCVSPNPGTLEDHVSKYKNGYYANNSDYDSIKASLLSLIQDYKNCNLPVFDNESLSFFFEKDIVKIFNGII